MILRQHLVSKQRSLA